MESYVKEVFALCGSTRFKKYYEVVARQLELSGRIVLWPGVYSKADNVPAELLTELTISNLKHAQNYKIDMCNYLYVINPEGYIGDDTKEEIAYAILNHKSVMYLESDDEMNQIFNSMAGITDAIEEMHDEEEKAKYFASHPDTMVDACSDVNPYGDIIEGLKEIQGAVKEAQDICHQIHEESEPEYEEPQCEVDEEEADDGSIIREIDGLSKIMIGMTVLICVLLIGLGAYSCSLISDLNDKYTQTTEKLMELDEILKDMHADLEHVNDRISSSIDGTGAISRNIKLLNDKVETTNNILTIVGRKVYQEWPN